MPAILPERLAGWGCAGCGIAATALGGIVDERVQVGVHD